MPFLATINVPGYLPTDDDPPIFDTAREAWEYLEDEHAQAQDHGLPIDVRPDFDYLGEDDRYGDRFVQYRGSWYDVLDSQAVSSPSQQRFGDMRATEANGLIGWDAIQSDSYWSAVVFRWPTEDEVFRHDLYMDRYGYIIVGSWSAD